MNKRASKESPLSPIPEDTQNLIGKKRDKTKSLFPLQPIAPTLATEGDRETHTHTYTHTETHTGNYVNYNSTLTPECIFLDDGGFY